MTPCHDVLAMVMPAVVTNDGSEPTAPADGSMLQTATFHGQSSVVVTALPSGVEAWHPTHMAVPAVVRLDSVLGWPDAPIILVVICAGVSADTTPSSPGLKP